MTNSISFDNSQMLYLDSGIRISSTSVFNAQEAYETSFEDLMLEEATKIEENNQKQQNNNFINIGMPPGFNLDTSFLEEMENSKNEQNQNSNKNSNFAHQIYFNIEENV